MNGKDKISVIIPCYNVQKYIMRCFDSIYSQTYGFENLEVILIDDLSTDNTWSILESLQRKYPENVISLKIQKKGKCGGARNLGMDICTGKYITFVDADDYVHPDMLRVLYDRMTEDDYDVAQCGVSCFKADKPNVLEVNDFEIQRLDLDNVDNRKNLIIGLTGFTNVTAWAKLYSTKFIIEHNLRFIEDVYYEDTHFSMLCVLLAKKYCKVQSTLYYYFENTEGIIRSEISNAKIRDAKIIMDHIRQAIQSRKAELGNVIEQCYCEIQTFLLWHQYIEPYSRIETFMNRELDICKEEFLKSEPDIFNNPYVKFFSDDVVLKRMSRLRVTAKKMNNVCFLDNAIHICLGIHDKDGNYSVWAGTTMQSIVENTKAPIVFHILHDDTLNEINKNKLSLIADNSGNDIEFHHFNSDVFGTFADSMNRFAIGTMFRIMLPDIMPDLKKIIYLDSDLFVNTDIEELWNLNIDNYCLAAAQDCSTIRNWGTPYAVAAGQTSRDRYFNAGVLCMNLDNIRKNGSLFQQVIDYLNDNPRTWLPDQDGRRRGRKKDNDKNTNTQQYTSMLNRYILDNISYKLDAGLTLSDMQSAATVSDYLMLRVYQGLSRQREHIGDEEAYEQFVREATLKAVDDGWVELIDYLEQLKYAVAGRASAQRNVMFEYQNEAFESFLDTEKAVKCNIIRNILLSDVKIGKDGRLQVIYP